MCYVQFNFPSVIFEKPDKVVQINACLSTHVITQQVILGEGRLPDDCSYVRDASRARVDSAATDVNSRRM